MSALREQALTIVVDASRRVSALLVTPPDSRACYVLAHGAGAGMTHPFMSAVARGLFQRGIATLRFQFPYMEMGSKRTDTPKLAQATVRAAVGEATRLVALPLVAGGKSFGGRMTSQAQSALPLPGVRGLAFLGFPLHPPDQPADERGRHLADVQVPMLFLQGSRDDFAQLALLQPLVAALGARATLQTFADADHSFHLPARVPRKDPELLGDVLDTLARWLDATVLA